MTLMLGAALSHLLELLVTREEGLLGRQWLQRAGLDFRVSWVHRALSKG